MEQLSKNSHLLENWKTIRHFSTFQQYAAERGVICFIIADSYKEPFNFNEPCWRGIFVWKDKDGNIVEDDCGSTNSIPEIETRLMECVIDLLMEC